MSATSSPEKSHPLRAPWKAKLSKWRAIYYIFDVSDGKGYVGSAYGNSNLRGRWRGYTAKGHGGNQLLRNRQPINFRFSILQRVSPDMDAADMIRLEATWKERLHIRAPFWPERQLTFLHAEERPTTANGLSRIAA